MQVKFSLKAQHIVLIVLIGTIFRFFYGVYTTSWLNAPDQLAWGLAINEMLASGDFSYKQLIHYPHEGGSALVALIAIALKPIEGLMPGLSLAALLIDSIIRYFQIALGQKMFGGKVALFYAIWSVAGVPLTLDWSVINFGLHHLASIWPFVFLYVVSISNSKPYGLWLPGICAGIALSFSYDSMILVLGYVFWILTRPESIRLRLKHLISFVLICALVFLPHLALRLIPDNGFNLEKLQLTEIRGITVHNLISLDGFKHLLSVWFKPLPASFFLSTTTFGLNILAMAFIFSGIFYAYVNYQYQPQHKFPILVILFFLVVYAFSPFYEPSSSAGSYVSYRHINYILPLLIMVLFSVFANIQKQSMGTIVISTWITLCLFFTVVFFKNSEPVNYGEYRAAGWVLAKKFGDEPKILINCKALLTQEERDKLCVGFGWGITATLFANQKENDQNRIVILQDFIKQFGEKDKELLLQGVEMAFKPGISPVLEPELLPAIKMAIIKE